MDRTSTDLPPRSAPRPAAPLAPLRLPRTLAERLDAWAVAALPAEACGLLVGSRGPDGVRVREVLRLTNVARGALADLFELDPSEQLAVEDAARRAGLEVVGVWHSHPDSAARPSVTDLARAWAGWSYPIVGRAAQAARELRSWRIQGERAVEEPLVDAPHEPVALDLPLRFTALPSSAVPFPGPARASDVPPHRSSR